MEIQAHGQASTQADRDGQRTKADRSLRVKLSPKAAEGVLRLEEELGKRGLEGRINKEELVSAAIEHFVPSSHWVGLLEEMTPLAYRMEVVMRDQGAREKLEEFVAGLTLGPKKRGRPGKVGRTSVS